MSYQDLGKPRPDQSPLHVWLPLAIAAVALIVLTSLAVDQLGNLGNVGTLLQ